MVSALSGPAGSLGLNMRAGVLAAFEEANHAGGIGGRTVELLCADDGYEPARTGQAVRQLIDRDGVVAIIGSVGTPTGVVAMPICREKRVPFVAPFTGAASLRPVPPDPMVFHFRAGYHEEIGAMVDALLDHAGLSFKDIAFFTQRDAYGDAGFAGGLAAFKRRGAPEGFRPLHVRYERNTLDVESALADCLSAEPRPRAIVMVGAYAPCAQFIRMARESGFNPLFLNVSFVGAEALARAFGAGKAGEGVIVTEVVPTLDRQTPLTKEFAQALSALPSQTRVEPSLGALEGYLSGRMACLALRKCRGEPTPKSFASALAGLGSFDLGLGTPLALDSKDHQACHTVWSSIIHGGRIVAFDWKDLSPAKK
jgi:ABC-type branched-subunit amino acid transport system substrate-binding protein